MNESRSDRNATSTDGELGPSPELLAELGPLAYALLALGEAGPLAKVQSLDASQAARVPAQADRPSERDTRSEALLGELGELDL